MVNRHRGEIEAVLNDRPYPLCLTLGALAELETAFGAEDMLALAERFQTGRLSAYDAIRIVAAGLRGGGHDCTEAEVAQMHAEDGAAGFVDIVVRLLAATFGMPEERRAEEAAAPGKPRTPEAQPVRRPSHGMT